MEACMADGIRCKHCGHQETEHRIPLEPTEPQDKKVPGFEMSISECWLAYGFNGAFGFEPEDPELAKELADQRYRREHLL
jgi:hypothetical protein